VIESVSKHNNRKFGECVGESTDFRLHHTHGGPQGDPERRRAERLIVFRKMFCLFFLFDFLKKSERDRQREWEKALKKTEVLF
jgi:hypothetical protein